MLWEEKVSLCVNQVHEKEFKVLKWSRADLGIILTGEPVSRSRGRGIDPSRGETIGTELFSLKGILSLIGGCSRLICLIFRSGEELLWQRQKRYLRNRGSLDFLW